MHPTKKHVTQIHLHRTLITSLFLYLQSPFSMPKTTLLIYPINISSPSPSGRQIWDLFSQTLRTGKDLRDHFLSEMTSLCLFFVSVVVSFINLFIFGCVGSSLLRTGFSLVVASGACSSLRCAGFSLQWLPLWRSTGSRHAGFSSCGLQAQ